MEVVNSESKPQFLRPLRDLFLSEWKKIDSFKGNSFGSNPPPPLLAIHDDSLIGGLSFTWYCPEGFSAVKLWINAVFVKPEFRGAGVATALIKEAIISAAQANEHHLYVYTAIPQLYTRLGWQHVSSQGQNNVLSINLYNHV